MEGMSSSTGYTNNPPQPNQESSSSKLLLPTADGKRNQRGGILSPTQSLDLYDHQFSIRQHQQIQREEGREPDPDPDPPRSATGASNCNTAPPNQAQPAADTATASITYGECQKNHAASIGGHVLDGCGEFMPSGDEGTTEALKCAACECHRSFHRRKLVGGGENIQQLMANNYYPHNPNENYNSIRRTTNHHIQPPPSHHRHYSHSLASTPTTGPIMMAFGGAGRGPAESSSEDLNMLGGGQQMGVPPGFSVSKKRFRTKFTKEQKDKMHEVAEKIGWKIQKQHDEEVQQLCQELGLKRQVFKVWMHNNKQAMKKKEHE